MEHLTASDLKTVLHSKRANLYYLEHCRVLVSGGRVSYVTDQGNRSLYWNIPIANTTSILLGTGTSITQAAMRELAKAGVMVGFSGGSGTPLIAGTERTEEIAWLLPQSEYRPTEYLQAWVSFWFDSRLRLEAARTLQLERLERVRHQWLGNRMSRESGFNISTNELEEVLGGTREYLLSASDTTRLLTAEARLTKRLFKMAAQATGYGSFVRSERGESSDPANSFLDHGNYLAYGLGATATWVLGLPHSLAVLHGKTRRGGLVFDAADLVKDGTVLPLAFIAAVRGDSEIEFRKRCIEALTRSESLDFIIDSLKSIAQKFGNSADLARLEGNQA